MRCPTPGEGTGEEAGPGPSGPISGRSASLGPVASGFEAGWPTPHGFGPLERSCCGQGPPPTPSPPAAPVADDTGRGWRDRTRFRHQRPYPLSLRNRGMAGSWVARSSRGPHTPDTPPAGLPPSPRWPLGQGPPPPRTTARYRLTPGKGRPQRRPRRTSAPRAARRFRAPSHCARRRSHPAKSRRPFGQLDFAVIVLITYPETPNQVLLC